MKLGLGLYRGMLDADHVRFAKQAGATHIVAHVPGHFAGSKARVLTAGHPGASFGVSDPDDPIWTYEGLRDLKALINGEGLQLEALENFAPALWSDILLDGPRRAEQIERLKLLLRDMGKVGIPVMGYYFSLAGVWGRIEGPFARGGAVSVGYENAVQSPIPKGMVWNMIYDVDAFEAGGEEPSVSVDEVRARLQGFLDELIPVAEEAGVRLALHPDDPPLRELRGTGRLVCHPDDWDTVYAMRPSPANAIELCLGTVGEMPGADIYDAVDRFSRDGRIGYIHFRNVKGKVPHYHEVFVDEGETDMIRILEILHQNHYEGVLIPDHTPLMAAPGPWHAGIAYALGYMKAAMALIQKG